MARLSQFGANSNSQQNHHFNEISVFRLFCVVIVVVVCMLKISGLQELHNLHYSVNSIAVQYQSSQCGWDTICAVLWSTWPAVDEGVSRSDGHAHFYYVSTAPMWWVWWLYLLFFKQVYIGVFAVYSDSHI